MRVALPPRALDATGASQSSTGLLGRKPDTGYRGLLSPDLGRRVRITASPQEPNNQNWVLSRSVRVPDPPNAILTG